MATDGIFGRKKDQRTREQEELERKKREEEEWLRKQKEQETFLWEQEEEEQRRKEEQLRREREAEIKRRKMTVLFGGIAALIVLLVTGYFTVHFWTDATCTRRAECKLCGKVKGGYAAHSWQSATCTDPRTCRVCGVTDGAAAGHSWTSGSCTEPGTCTVCGISNNTTLEHQWAAATCTDPMHCVLCGATDGAAAGHRWDEATCSSPRTCRVCGVTDGNPSGHSWKDASCTEPKTCRVCGVTDGNPSGHSWKDATCTKAETCSVCGKTNGSPLGHSWKEATYNSPKTCTRCGATEGSAKEEPQVKVDVGDYVYFGNYEQDGNLSNGKEMLEWLVLDKSGDYYLLISRYGLDQHPYHTKGGSVTWENCDLRKWLNGDFYDDAFNSGYQSMIGLAENPADPNPDYSTDPGRKTQDKVFLLSLQEVVYYFPNYTDRTCLATDYAKAQGAFTRPGTGTCWWWVRTPGDGKDKAASINSTGTYDSDGSDVAGTSGAVRPCVWVKIS